ncbi:hypothetical protein E3T26_00840 [Cryobacterium sp. TMT1-21]|nr:hypothetical protein E3T24_15290 [Cryobacterium sp. TmT2-59]TFD18053.1 hypothetical protein E3T26_00840 [Cryobacterium sp. TMT1-21]TFD19632.1 hypothetical protein E3T42_03510 [Cryobacterium sp. TMT4-10]TFD40866.1 hypothetical protein E3T37_05205 [Cryobacterium sp. TMT2-10]
MSTARSSGWIPTTGRQCSSSGTPTACRWRSTNADPVSGAIGRVARAIVASAPQAELFLYPGDQHYFADSSLPSYDAGAAELLLERVIGFLGKIPG